MRVTYSESIEYKTLLRIKSIRVSVVLREDLTDLGSYRQVSRAINKLIEDKKLVKIGSGVYAKAYQSKYSNTHY